jgi:RNA-directed DNA polymerase
VKLRWLAGEGTESLAAKRRTESPAITEQLMEEVCERENCKQALARVKANKGSPGVEGMTVHVECSCNGR